MNVGGSRLARRRTLFVSMAIVAGGWFAAAPALAADPLTPTFFHCGDANADDSLKAGDALLILRAAVGTHTGCSAMVCDAVGGFDGVKASDALAVLRAAVGSSGPSTLRCPSAARIWDEELLAAIRLDIPRPTVHARNLFHLSIALWDAWVAYDNGTNAQPYLFSEQPTADADVYSARTTAMSYASYRLLQHRFANSPGKTTSLAALNARMESLGLDRTFTGTSGDSAAAVGNRIAAAVITYGLADGSNEANDYADNTGYAPQNPPLYPALSGTTMAKPNLWQPLSLEYSVTQNGIPLPITKQTFICPHWAAVTPFATAFANAQAPPWLGGLGDDEFKQSALQVIRFSSRLDPVDGVTINISPGAKGNSTLGTDDGVGHALNPSTGAPYDVTMVKRADWARVLAEFWADGPHSETPPGHWNVLANQVADHPAFQKRIGGAGDGLDNLEWDVKAYLALNGAVQDAAISAWGNKGLHDSARPISMIRYMAGRGQSTNPAGPSYSVSGLPLESGLVEVITASSSATGQRHAHLADHVGKIAIRAWRGNPFDPIGQVSGVGWILGIDWVPYQRATFVTPAFAAYTSGHSTFSRAAAEVMTTLTGDAFFPGGISEFRAVANSYLGFEKGPSAAVTLQWATYRDAADEAGLSRLYGGIHIRADDYAGRVLGEQIGKNAAALAATYWDGTIGE